MTDLGHHPPGATPLDPEDLAGLRQAWITTRSELDHAEADNILIGRLWAYRRRGRFWYLTPDQLHTVHRRMFDQVWTWAGRTRQRETNIGVDPHRITEAVHNLCADAHAQIGDGTATAYPVAELAVRFHHRLVAIHPYPNGNGRHARLASDLLARDLGAPAFSWGSGDLSNPTSTRERYISALRHADSAGDYGALLEFAQS